MKLTRRPFIEAPVATAGLLAIGCATQPATAAKEARKAKPAGPAKGKWVSP